MDFKYIVPDILVSGGALPLQSAMEALAKGFFNFYSSSGWKSFVFMIYPICALLGLMGLSHKLSTGEETWGKGCSNFIWKVMLATGILVIAPNSPKYLTELINQTSSTLRIQDDLLSPSELLLHPHISMLYTSILEDHERELSKYKDFMESPINSLSEKVPDVYGKSIDFKKVTGLGDPNSDGIGFPNVNFHDSTNEAGKIIPSTAITPSVLSGVDKLGNTYEFKVSPLSLSVREAVVKMNSAVQFAMDSNTTAEAIAEVKTNILPLFNFELTVIRKSLLADYVSYVLLGKTMKYHTDISKDNSPENIQKSQAKADAAYSGLFEIMYNGLNDMEENIQEGNTLSSLPGWLFDFSMIFISIYVTLSIYILPVVLPLWAAMYLLPDSFQLSQSLTKGLTIVITTWFLPIFLDLIILVGNSFQGVFSSPDAESNFILKIISSLMGGFVSMMLIIASPLIVNKLISGSSGFIDTVTSSIQKAAGMLSAATIGGASMAAAVAAPVTGGGSLVAGAAAAGAGGAANKVSSGVIGAVNPGPMDSA